MGETCSVCGSGDKNGTDLAKAPIMTHIYSSQGAEMCKAGTDYDKACGDEDSKNKLDKKQEKDKDAMTDAFAAVDTNGDGVISLAEWEKVKEATKMKTITSDKSEGSSKKHGKKTGRYNPNELEDLFNKVDLDNNGLVDVTEMATLFRLLGMAYTTKSIKNLLSLIDEDQGGTISLSEFVSFFSHTKKGLDLDKVVSQALEAQAKQRMTDSDKIDVFILHAMEPDVGYRKCYWLADMLEESEGLTCAGPFRRAQMKLEHPEAASADDKDATFVFRVPTEDELASPTEAVHIDLPDVARSNCLVLLLDSQSLVGKAETDFLDAAGDAGIPVVCFYEHEPGYREDLEAWKLACPLALANTHAKPMTRYFPRDSGEVCTSQIMHTLKRSRKSEVQAPSMDLNVEYENLHGLGQLPNVQWLTPEFAMVIDANSSDLPSTAFAFPGRARPYYISYPHANLASAGLTAKQLAKLRIVLNGNQLEGRVIFYDAVSVERDFDTSVATLVCDTDVLAELMLMSSYIIIDDVDPEGACKYDYLSRGLNFMEAVLAVLTGNLLPARPGQLEDLDKTIGKDVSGGKETLRQVVKANARSPSTIINRVCSTLKRKHFASSAEKDLCLQFLPSALQRHPLLVETANDVGPFASSGSKTSFVRRLSMKGIKSSVSSKSSERSSGTEAAPALARRPSMMLRKSTSVVTSLLSKKGKKKNQSSEAVGADET